MAGTYTTKPGDQWDIIAKEVYGSESYTDYLMSNNFALLDVYEFDAGVILNTPDAPEQKSETLPAWRNAE
jgi:hypothetical protein